MFLGSWIDDFSARHNIPKNVNIQRQNTIMTGQISCMNANGRIVVINIHWYFLALWSVVVLQALGRVSGSPRFG